MTTVSLLVSPAFDASHWLAKVVASILAVIAVKSPLVTFHAFGESSFTISQTAIWNAPEADALAFAAVK